MRMVRFHKHQFNFWLNGDEHWLLQGQHYEAHESEEDIVKKLRNAAWYRGITVAIRVYPDRIWVKAKEEMANVHRPATRYQTVESQLDGLKKEDARLLSVLNVLTQEVSDLRAKFQEMEDQLQKVNPNGQE